MDQKPTWIGALPLVLATAASLVQTGIQWYTQVSTYPLFHYLPDDAFVAYHRAYERRLPLTIYLPYATLMVSSLALLGRRPAGLALAPALLVNLLNASIMALSLGGAAPTHRRLDQGNIDRHTGITQLVRWNAGRLVVSTISSGLMLYLLARRVAGSHR